MLETLSELSKYGFIDIFFGLGIPAVIWGLIRKRFSRNYEFLHISVFKEGSAEIPRSQEILPILRIQLSNAGGSNILIASGAFYEKEGSKRVDTGD